MTFVVKIECKYEDLDNCPQGYDCVRCLNLQLLEYVRVIKEIESW